MTVGELIEALKDEEQDRPVVISYDYGDRRHTTVCEEVHRVEEMPVKFSDYHRKLVIDEDQYNDRETAVVLGG